jgi:hypothetical protein
MWRGQGQRRGSLSGFDVLQAPTCGPLKIWLASLAYIFDESKHWSFAALHAASNTVDWSFATRHAAINTALVGSKRDEKV